MLKFRVVRIDEIKSSFRTAPRRSGGAATGELVPQPDHVITRREAWLSLENADAPPQPQVFVDVKNQVPLGTIIVDCARLGDDIKNGDEFELRKVD